MSFPCHFPVLSLSRPYIVPSCFLFTQTNPYFILLFFSLSVEGEWGNRVGWWIIDINAGVKDNTEDLNRAAVAGNYFQNLQTWHLVSMDLTSHIRRVTIEWLWVIVYQYFVISIIILQKHSLKKLSKDILFSLLSNTYTFHTHLLRYQLMNFKSRQEWGQMKAFSYRNCCSKRIFLKNHYFVR